MLTNQNNSNLTRTDNAFQQLRDKGHKPANIETLQTIITDSYNKLKIMMDILNRTTLTIQQQETIIKEQANKIKSLNKHYLFLEKKIDELYEKLENSKKESLFKKFLNLFK